MLLSTIDYSIAKSRNNTNTKLIISSPPTYNTSPSIYIQGEFFHGSWPCCLLGGGGSGGNGKGGPGTYGTRGGGGGSGGGGAKKGIGGKFKKGGGGGEGRKGTGGRLYKGGGGGLSGLGGRIEGGGGMNSNNGGQKVSLCSSTASVLPISPLPTRALVVF